MLTFTTTQPHSMFGSGEPLVPQRKRAILNAHDVHTCVYLHGEIQGLAGFDIPVLVEGDLDMGLEHMGEECMVEPFPFEPKRCKLYMWFDGSNVTGLESGRKLRSVHGLIVAEDDAAGLAYARERMAIRAKHL